MALLTRVPFFRDCGLDLETLEKRCIVKRFDDGEVVLDFDDHTSDVYFLASGDVRVLFRTQAGKEVIFGDLRSGQFFGELAAIDNVPRSANVTALTRAEMVIMSANIFRESVFGTPTLSERMMKILTARTRELNARLMEQAVLDLRHRLYSELLRLSLPRPGHEGERVITPPPFHHVLAARIGCRREQVTREFTTMTEQGLVEKTRGAIILKKPSVLEQRIAEALREGE
ncbi:Crp/Fnr family transcriptional regulator [Terrarubrum flagellatum]|uniref:Crp/Fnr family transcriptional regulator n=1 Tax=Terrirubrum flagellatum TaxID=2895980 RepID=UPI00314560F8